MEVPVTKGAKIPKVIHQIWIGKNPAPWIWMDTVREFCDAHGYKYMFWDEKLIETHLKFDAFPSAKEAYMLQEELKQLAGKCDILRYMILYKYGGIYIDADTVVLKPAKFAEFLETNEAHLFFGKEDLKPEFIQFVINGDRSPDVHGRTWLVANGLIGVKPNHPFFKRVLDECGEYSKRMRGKGAWREVGPAYITTLYEEMKEQYPDIMVYPMSYFYPLDWHGIIDPEHHKKVTVPEESMLFQYGYSTNHFDKIFKLRAMWAMVWPALGLLGALLLVYIGWCTMAKPSRGTASRGWVTLLKSWASKLRLSRFR